VHFGDLRGEVPVLRMLRDADPVPVELRGEAPASLRGAVSVLRGRRAAVPVPRGRRGGVPVFEV